MADEQIPARLEKFSLTVRMDATLTVNDDQHWIKPGTEGGMTWKGYMYDGKWMDPIPTPDQVKSAFELIQRHILAPVLDEMVVLATRRIAEVQKQR